MSRLLTSAALATLLSACAAGEVYPELYAEAYCQTAYTCVGEDAVEAAVAYTDQDDCRAAVQAAVEADPKYKAYTEGDCDWDADSAKTCLEEVAEIRQDDACDGAMGFAAFLADAATPACAAVYSGCL
jgi:hypothetical protein